MNTAIQRATVSSRAMIRRAIRTACITGLVWTTSVPVTYAQDPTIDEVIVTGSRVRVRDFESTSPVATVTAEAINATGQLSVEEVLNRLPQVVPGFTANSNNPANGTATVDLRGIGTPRTLVLVNGRRLTPSTQLGVTDLNNIPVRLIDRVEVVTGGASAVYGSDALAGVVNFILKSDFDGFDVGYQFGESAESDGAEKQVDLLLGGNLDDDRGNVTAFASWYERDSILQGAREYTRVDRSGGSPTGNARMPNVPLNPFPTTGAFLGGAGTARQYAFSVENDGGVRAWNNTLPETSADGQGDRYNFSPTNFLLSPGERLSLGAFGHWNFNEHLTAYTDVMYVDSRNAQQLAPTPAVSIAFDADSPVLSPQARALLAARPQPTADAFLTRRMTEVGPRLQENKSKLEQVTLGIRGNLPVKDWTFDAYYEYGRTDFTNVTHNDVSRTKFAAGLSGCPESYARFVPDCVPIAAFGVNTLTAPMVDFIRLNFTDVTLFERNLASAALSGSLFDVPAGPLGFAIGVEYRDDSSSYTPDIVKEQGDILGFNAQQPVAGRFNVSEVFFEALVPLLKEVPGAYALSLDTGARYSHYSSIGEALTYKAGFDWAPVEGLHVRSMYQRAVRAPSVYELFLAGDQGFPSVDDPCATTLADGSSQDVSPEVTSFCRDTWGIDSSAYTQANTQIETFFYGNPNLREETSDTYTVGLTLAPKSVPALNVSIDYYTMKIEDYAGPLAGGTTGVVLDCFASLNITSESCLSGDLGLPLVFRDAIGELKARVPLANISALETSGVDLNVGYAVPLPFASGTFGSNLDVSLLATWLESWKLDEIDYAGTIGGYNYSGAFPEYKANLRLAYRIGPVDLAYGLEFIDAMDNQGNIPEFGDNRRYEGVGSTLYHDLSALWAVTDAVQLSLGIRNLTNVEPKPFDIPIDQNTDPSTYDMLGRFYHVSLRAKF